MLAVTNTSRGQCVRRLSVNSVAHERSFCGPTSATAVPIDLTGTRRPTCVELMNLSSFCARTGSRTISDSTSLSEMSGALRLAISRKVVSRSEGVRRPVTSRGREKKYP